MKTRILGLFGMGLMAACVAPAQTDRKVDDAALRAAPPEEWLTNGRDYSEQHYSPLNQINDQNVARLGLVWTYETESADGRLEAVPLISNGVMYGSLTWSVIFAVDARSGKLKWKFDPEIPRENFPDDATGPDRIRTGPSICCGPVNRGVALYNDKVLAGLLDGSLVALDADTGKVLWRVQTTPKNEDYSITGAPRVVKGKVIIGNAGADFGVRGFVAAYDVETGYEVWRFYTVPGDPARGFENTAMAMAATTWTGEWWKMGGGGTVWDGMAYDPEADLLYVGTGNGGPWNRNVRSPGGGDNLFLSSIVALRPDTGEYVWHYQTTPGDTWDFTATQPLMLADLTINGRLRKVILQAPKNGFFYVIDRLTGEFISGQPYVNSITWATGIDAKGRPIEAPGARYEKGAFQGAPDERGGHAWQAMSFNPVTKLVYVPGRESRNIFRAERFRYVPGRFNIGVATDPAPADGEPNPVPAPQQGKGLSPRFVATRFLVAYDPVEAKVRWRVPAERGFGGGTLSTAGNLVFGAGDNKLIAYSADTGRERWKAEIASAPAQPVTYLLDGKQYVSVLAGHRNGRVYTFALDGKLPLPSPLSPE